MQSCHLILQIENKDIFIIKFIKKKKKYKYIQEKISQFKTFLINRIFLLNFIIKF